MKSGYPPYAFSQIAKLPRVTAPWLVNVKQAGRYRLTLRQWPEAAGKPVVAVRAKVKLSGQEKECMVEPGSKGVVIDLDLPAGPSELWTYLYDASGKAGGAYFTEVQWIEKDRTTPPPITTNAKKDAPVEIETAAHARGFTKLPLPSSPFGTITASHPFKDAPLASLVDGQLAKGYGPVFANGVDNGAYKMDLGSVLPIAGITSWSCNMSNTRGAQKIAIYGSNASTDPGWDLASFTSLGTIDTTNAPKAAYTAASLRAVDGQTLGTFRWILWAVSPVYNRGGGENTALQELAVEWAK